MVGRQHRTRLGRSGRHQGGHRHAGQHRPQSDRDPRSIDSSRHDRFVIMQQTTTIDDRPTLVTFMDEMFVPVDDPDEAALVKVQFLDRRGGVAFLVPRTFDPNQPRDESGKWTSGGGGGESAGSEEAKPKGSSATELYLSGQQQVDLDAVLDAHPGAREQIAKASEMLANTAPTNALVADGGYMQEDGSFTPERQKVHEAILKKIFTKEAIEAATPKQGETPTLSIFGGRGGSGKGWFTSSGLVDRSKAIYINSDDMKEALPEYAGWNAAVLHEEAT